MPSVAFWTQPVLTGVFPFPPTPPGTIMPSSLSRIRFSVPTARRFSSNVAYSGFVKKPSRVFFDSAPDLSSGVAYLCMDIGKLLSKNLRGSFGGNDDVDDVVGALVHLLRNERHRFHEGVEVDLLSGLVL